MNWHALFITAIGNVMPAALMQIFPFWQRTFFFTVRVPEGFHETEAGRRIVRDFRLAALSVSLLCGVAMYAGIVAQVSWLIMPAPLLSNAMLIALLQWTRSRTLPYAAPPAGTVRRASLAGDDQDQPWWVWAAPLAGLAIMSTAAAFVSIHWNELPERFPVHWGLDGQPNRWNRKTLSGVYGILGLGLMMQALMAFLLYALSQSSSRTSLRSRTNQAIVAMAGLGSSTLHSAILLFPLRGTAASLPGPMWLWMILPLVFVIPAALLAMIRLQRCEDDELEPTRDEKWWGGMFYADSSDSRMMVPNRMGAGYTPNLGHPLVRVVVPLWLVSFFGLVSAMR